ncbi:hypothetical protein GR160_01090 [Flavobacterium sp. Sd200]|uniref:hypothetical protein n=1 Tax=Flavobacterium sp. Sd200 TaxID=2692211 RepID=UPI00136B7423|nr:hypothetical protein [Flavobacterium sp. Sd200]MXN89810.1 hypothetical protein [Flavobacterium sp. Sd200]
MEKRDYLESQIEQLGLVLKNIIGFLIGKKSPGLETSKQLASLALKAELGFDPDEAVMLGDDDFLQRLIDTGKFNEGNYEKLADVLYLMAQEQLQTENRGEAKQLFNKSLLLYRYLERTEKKYSFYRNSRIVAIQSYGVN